MNNKIYLLALITHLTCTSFDFVDNKKHGALHSDFFEEIIEAFHPDIFIETGTFCGQTTKNAAPYFKEVHTVELYPTLYNSAKSRLANIKNITVYCDHSPAMITKIAPKLEGDILFWLDAHYCGNNTAVSNDNPYDPKAITAICEELCAIKESDIQNCTILIDDIRGFGTIINGTEYIGCWAYPSVQEICKLGKQINEHFSFALLGDTLLMYDSSKFSPQLSQVVKACTESRLYDGSNLTDDELIEHEKIIINAQDNEKDFITTLYQRTTTNKDPVFHYDLWYALVCMGSGNWQEASIALQKVPNRLEHYRDGKPAHKPLQYNHWRIQNYLSVITNKLNT